METHIETLRGLDVERVRTAAEAWLAVHCDALPGWYYRGEYSRDEMAALRRVFTSTGLRITPEVAPAVHAVIESAKRTLDVALPVEAYQVAMRGGSAWNAHSMGYGDRVLISLDGSLLLHLDEAGQRSVVGHELGHYLAHARRPPWLDEARWLVAPSFRSERAFYLATELTADRFGLLVTRDLDACLRVEMSAATGLPAAQLGWNPRAYLAQSRQAMEELADAGGVTGGVTHPEHGMRAYALWLFSETDIYRELTGEGPGSRSLAAVEMQLARLLGVPLPAGFNPARVAAEPPVRPAPKPVRYAPLRGIDERAAGDDAAGDDAEEVVTFRVPTPLESLKEAAGRATEKVRTALRGDGGGRAAPTEEPPDEPFDDPLERDLLDRFAELERRVKKA